MYCWSSSSTVPLSWNEKKWSLWSSHILVLLFSPFSQGLFFFSSFSFPSSSPPPSCLPHLDSFGCLLFFSSMEMSKAQGKRTLMEEEEEDDEDTVGLGFGEDEKKKKAVTLTNKKGSGGAGSTPPSCQVDNCTVDMSDAKRYHKRHRVCEHHAKAPVILIAGIQQRFCQQCSRFHELSEFDDTKRSCRRRLAGHNERRRKSSSESHGEGSSWKGKTPHLKEELSCSRLW